MYLGLTRESPFPIINDDTLLRLALAEKDEIKFMRQDNGATVCSYIVSMEETFDTPMAREARGITFDADGKIISRVLHKFFNINERESTKFENIDWSKATRCMVKRDGSMISTVKGFSSYEGADFALKSKKSFTSDVVVRSVEWLQANDEARAAFTALCNHVVARGWTATFEWTSPISRIVLYYETASLTLLHVRDNVSGRYLTQAELEALTSKFNVPLVANEQHILEGLTAEKLIKLFHETEGVEGWVFQFENGDMVKFKTEWYMKRHKAMTFLRERDIAELVIDEGLDDMKALLVGEGVDIGRILEIEHQVVTEINAIAHEVETLYLQVKDLDRKTVALSMREKTKYFGLLMTRYSGKEIDVKEFYRKNLLSERWTLTQINLGQVEVA